MTCTFPPSTLYVIGPRLPWLLSLPTSNASIHFHIPSINYIQHLQAHHTQTSNTMVSAIIYKPNEHADEYIVFVDDDKEVSRVTAGGWSGVGVGWRAPRSWRR